MEGNRRGQFEQCEVRHAPTRHERRVLEVALELLGFQRGRHDHNLQRRALHKHLGSGARVSQRRIVATPTFPGRACLLEQAEEDVGGERTLVRLVQHDNAVSRHQRVRHRLAEQHAVRHVPARRRRERTAAQERVAQPRRP